MQFARNWKQGGSQRFWARAYLKSVYLQSVLAIFFPIDAIISLIIYITLAHGLHIYYTASFWLLLALGWSLPPCFFILHLYLKKRKTNKKKLYDLEDEDLREDYERDTLVEREEEEDRDEWGRGSNSVQRGFINNDDNDEGGLIHPRRVKKEEGFALDFIAHGYVEHKFVPTIWNGLGISACIFGLLASIMGSVCNFLVGDIAGGLAAIMTFFTVVGCMYFIIHRSFNVKEPAMEFEMSKEDEQHVRKTRLIGFAWRVAVSFAGIIAVSITILSALQSFVYAFNVHYYPPPGRMYDIGGSRSMHMNCNGTGGPTVVFLHGWGGQAYDWSWVQPDVSAFAKTCSLDRTGYGWSDPPNCVLCSRTAEQKAKDLDALLRASGVDSDSVTFVAHGSAVLDVRVFIHTYTTYKVCGIVCVDCVDTGDLAIVGSHAKNPTPSFWDLWRNFLPSGIPGVLAASNSLPGFEIINTLPNNIHPIYIQNQFKPKYPQSVVRDYEDLPQSAQQAIDAGDFGNLQFTAIIAGKGINDPNVTYLSTNTSYLYVPKAPRDMHYHKIFAPIITEQIRSSVANSKYSGCAVNPLFSSP